MVLEGKEECCFPGILDRMDWLLYSSGVGEWNRAHLSIGDLNGREVAEVIGEVFKMYTR